MHIILVLWTAICALCPDALPAVYIVQGMPLTLGLLQYTRWTMSSGNTQLWKAHLARLRPTATESNAMTTRRTSDCRVALTTAPLRCAGRLALRDRPADCTACAKTLHQHI